MSDSDVKSSNSSRKSALTNSFALGAFAIGTALILGLTYTATKDPIADSERKAEEQALLEVLGEQSFDNDLLTDLIPLHSELIDSLNSKSETARVVRSEGATVGFIFTTTAPDGYSGDIDLIVGLDRSGEILGARVVSHRETPGLGDKIDIRKNDWILQFAGLSLSNPNPDQWAVKKDGGQFDGFTGATITPRAVVNMIKNLLEVYDVQSDALLKDAQQVESIQVSELPVSGS